MSEKSKDLNIDVAYNTFGMGLMVGIGVGSTRDAMNQLVSEAKANGFKIKATEKPLSHTVQNNLNKNSNEAER